MVLLLPAIPAPVKQAKSFWKQDKQRMECMKVDFLSTSVPRVGTNQRLLTLAALLLGFALRLYRLGAESLWYDETVSVALAQKSLPDLIRHTAGDIHPPGYYLLLHFWQALTHPTPAFGLEFLYAWPSLVCGLLVMALLFPLGRALSTQRLALVALWLAAINPYHIWYSQEVRMYTVGALLGLLCFWAMVQWRHSLILTTRNKNHWLIGYVLAGALGLYTLYYFLFTLIALNFIALALWLQARSRRVSTVRPLAYWIGAQVAVALLWSPWLPIFWRQATEPPVPPWRIPWESGARLLAAVGESASALISGQSTPMAAAWYWLLLLIVVLVVAYFHYTKYNYLSFTQRNAYFILLSYLLIPIVALYAITAVVTPIYHVRYLFIYAPPLLLLIGAALLYGIERQRFLGGVVAVLFVALNGWSLFNFWVAPTFQTDDHRAAVAHLATHWRPGDAILVNAGWVYTALTTYWPTELVGVDSATPPPLAQITRLVDAAATQPQARPLTQPALMRSGSIDGAANLGWGDPASDFFAISTATTNQALQALAQVYSRLWHYRLYDTVNDPTGVIRSWFSTYTTLLSDSPIPGRDFLRLQLYQSKQTPIGIKQLPPLDLPPVHFVGDLQLEQAALFSPTVAAGEYLYTRLVWQPPLDHTNLPPVIPPVIGFSLRLSTAEGYLLAQADETPLPLLAWPTDYAFTLALPVPIATPPGAYHLVLVVYDAKNGEPLAGLGNMAGARDLPLGMVQVTPATRVPVITAVQTSFDYIDLVRARVATPTATPGAALAVELVWRPRANAYRDTYLGQLFLQNAQGVVVAQWEAALGGWDYPSGAWPALIPVRDWRTLPVDPAIPPGQYTLHLRVERAHDHQLIPARRSWWSGGDEGVVVGAVQVE
jgi:Dolichyl-phosphate-mannose-protein mannosyltransferase